MDPDSSTQVRGPPHADGGDGDDDDGDTFESTDAEE